MRKLKIIGLVALVAITIHGTVLAAEPTIKYFKRLAMDELYGVRGIHEMSEKPDKNSDYYVVEYDDHKRPLVINHWVEAAIKAETRSGVATTQFVYGDQQASIMLFNEARVPVNNRGGFHMIKMTLDPRGQVESCQFFDKYHQRVHNEESIYEVRCTHGSDNSRIIIFLDENLKLTTDSHGRMCLKEVVDENGRVIELVNLDSMGKPTNNGDSICTVRFTYDNDGQILTQTEYESDPALVPDDYALTTWSYDEKGVVVSVQYALMKVNKETLRDAELGYISKRKDFNDGLAIREAKALWN